MCVLGHRYSVEQELGGYPTNQQSPGDRRERFAAMKSLSTESQRSSQSSGSQTQRPIFLNAAGRPVGGSYATKFGQGPNAPKLSEVARMLMAAKEAGELPQASKKDLELQETVRLANLEKLQLAQQAQNGYSAQNGHPAHQKPKTSFAGYEGSRETYRRPMQRSMSLSNGLQRRNSQRVVIRPDEAFSKVHT